MLEGVPRGQKKESSVRKYNFRYPNLAEPVTVLAKSGDRVIGVRECPYCKKRPVSNFAGDLAFYSEAGGAGWPNGRWTYTCAAEGCRSGVEVEFVRKVS